MNNTNQSDQKPEQKDIKKNQELLNQLQERYTQQRKFFSVFVITAVVIGVVLLIIFVWQGSKIHQDHVYQQQQTTYNNNIYRTANNAVLKTKSEKGIKQLTTRYGMRVIFHKTINDVVDVNTANKLNLNQFTDLTGAPLGGAYVDLYIMQYPYKHNKLALIAFNASGNTEIIQNQNTDTVDLALYNLQAKLVSALDQYDKTGNNAGQVNKLITEYRNY